MEFLLSIVPPEDTRFPTSAEFANSQQAMVRSIKTHPHSSDRPDQHWDHRCGLEVTSLLLTQRARVRSPVGSISWLRFFPRFCLNSKTNVRKFWPHSSPVIVWPSYISSKPYIIRLRTATISDHSCSTWPSLNNHLSQIHFNINLPSVFGFS